MPALFGRTNLTPVKAIKGRVRGGVKCGGGSVVQRETDLRSEAQESVTGVLALDRRLSLAHCHADFSMHAKRLAANCSPISSFLFCLLCGPAVEELISGSSYMPFIIIGKTVQFECVGDLPPYLLHKNSFPFSSPTHGCPLPAHRPGGRWRAEITTRVPEQTLPHNPVIHLIRPVQQPDKEMRKRSYSPLSSARLCDLAESDGASTFHEYLCYLLCSRAKCQTKWLTATRMSEMMGYTISPCGAHSMRLLESFVILNVENA
jgi:hypothetical protein